MKNIGYLDFHHCTSDQLNDRKKKISSSEQESLNPRGKLIGVDFRCGFFTSKLKRLLHQECCQLQNCLSMSKLMQGQALNTIRPHNTFYSTLQPIQSCT